MKCLPPKDEIVRLQSCKVQLWSMNQASLMRLPCSGQYDSVDTSMLLSPDQRQMIDNKHCLSLLPGNMH